MRSPRHWLKKFYGEWRIESRRRELEKEMTEALGQPIRLTLFGDGGNDSIYLASSGNDKLAVVRLYNPFKKNFLQRQPKRRKPAGPGDPLKAVNREWEAYQALAESGVTPRPLWRTHDATAVSHIPAVRLNRFLGNLPAGDWESPVVATFKALARIHELGRAHHDAKVSNGLIDVDTGKVYLIDLDRLTHKTTSLENRQAADHLKLLASFLQIAPPELRNNGPFWRQVIAPLVMPEMREIDVSPLLTDPTVRHLARNKKVRHSLEGVFRGIDADH
jgi:hypothetical protein